MTTDNAISLVEAEISDLKRALDDGAITSVELVSKYLHRIETYDCNGPRLNSVCVLNPRVFEEAQASDEYRLSGLPVRPLEGIPYTVKDSFKVDQISVAAGSPAFADLISSADSAIVESLRAAGAIVLGKTNMPAMADGGGQRGVYGHAESPYNLDYSTTAFASGSSNGSGTSIAASFASFGFGGETVSSGRAPASNNALVGYSPSRGIIPLRGQWPLYPTCDVVVPHTRTMSDLFSVLNVIVRDDSTPEGDFWRSQKVITIPSASQVRPRDYHSLAIPSSLAGKRIAIPKCFVGKCDGALQPTVFSEPVRKLFDQAQSDIESLGAVLVETPFPLLEEYTRKDYPGQSANVPGFTRDWNNVERCKMIAMGWDDFLRNNNADAFPNLTVADPEKIHPLIAPMDDPTKHTESENHVHYKDMIDAVRVRDGSIHELPGCEQAAKALEAARKRNLEDWMNENKFDCLLFPTNGDVPRADAEEHEESMVHALQDGIKYSNGGRALKHLGVPAITVPMGTMEDKGMPVGLTFVGRAYDDNCLLQYAYAYERYTKRRTVPPLTPTLSSDHIALTRTVQERVSRLRLILTISSVFATKEDDEKSEVRNITLQGSVMHADKDTMLTLFLNGRLTENIEISGDQWKWTGHIGRPKVNERYPTIRPVPKDQFFITVLAKDGDGRCAGAFVLVD